jgi:transposase-like protein
MSTERRRFTPGFRLEAVCLADEIEKPSFPMARELGVRPDTLRAWRRHRALPARLTRVFTPEQPEADLAPSLRAPPFGQVHLALLQHLASGSLDPFSRSRSGVREDWVPDRCCRPDGYSGRWSASTLQMRDRVGNDFVVWKAQQRLCKLFHRVAARRAPQIAAVAVAREMVGFLWAVLQDVETETAQIGRKEAA